MKFINVKTENEIKELAALASKIWHEYWPCILTNEQINYMVEKYQSINAISGQLKKRKLYLPYSQNRKTYRIFWC